MYRYLLFIFTTVNILFANTNLSKAELQYIQNHQDGFNIGITHDYYPFSYYEHKQFSGYSIDLLKMIAKRSGLVFNYEINSWSQNLSNFKNKKIDIINTISYSKARAKYVDFSEAYFYISNVMFTKKNAFNDYKEIKSLKNTKVGITKDIYYFDAVKNLNLFDLVIFENSREKMKALAFGKVDVILNNLISGQKYIKAAGYTNIKVLDEIDPSVVSKEDLRFGIQKNNPMLRSIINKTLATITIKEKNELDTKWFGVKNVNNQNSPSITLSKSEEKYLTKKQHIVMCVDPNWLPLEKIENGKYIGLISDYLKLFEKIIDTKVILHPTKNWQDSINAMKLNECDILAAAEDIPSRHKYMNFTAPYLEIPLVIATKVGIPFIDDIRQVLNKKFAVVKGYSLIDKLQRNYKGIQLVLVNSIDEGLEKVQNEEVFGYIDNSAVINHAIEKTYIGSLAISAQLSNKYKLSIATRKDELILHGVFQKVIKSIDYRTKHNLNQKWIKVSYSIKTDYQLIYKIIAIALLLLLVSLYWNRKLNQLKVKAEEATKAKSSFIANMSHEIRTPMNAIVGMTHLIQESGIDEKQAKYINNIKKASGNLLYIINDILDFSKIEAGKLSIEKIDFNMNNTLTNIQNIANIKIADKDLSFTIHNHLKHNTFIGDSVRLSQVLINLIGNAIKFTVEGKVELFIKQLDNNQIRFIVKDTGIGMSKNEQKKLFSPFSQADESITRRYGGTGLGLAISKNLIELMNGQLFITSKKNEGSTFSFNLELPLSTEKNTKFHKYENKINLKEKIKTLHNTNILLVEDNEINREIIHSLLEDTGIQIDNAYDGQMALDLYNKNISKYDLILMDIQMPIKSGIEATKIIRQTDKKIPIIALSANAMKEDIIKTKRSGMNEHLNKPIEVDKLFNTLLKYIKPENLNIKHDIYYIPKYEYIDIKVGLSYLNENKKLYLSVLNNFYKQYSHVTKKELLDASVKDFIFMINSIQSLSLNIGALKLCEITIKAKNNTNNELRIAFYDALKEVTDELKDNFQETIQTHKG